MPDAVRFYTQQNFCLIIAVGDLQATRYRTTTVNCDSSNIHSKVTASHLITEMRY